MLRILNKRNRLGNKLQTNSLAASERQALIADLVIPPPGKAFLQPTPYVRDLTLWLWYSTSRFTSAAKHNTNASSTAASDTNA